jgi:hypothetical protein
MEAEVPSEIEQGLDGLLKLVFLDELADRRMASVHPAHVRGLLHSRIRIPHLRGGHGGGGPPPGTADHLNSSAWEEA